MAQRLHFGLQRFPGHLEQECETTNVSKIVYTYNLERTSYNECSHIFNSSTENWEHILLTLLICINSPVKAYVQWRTAIFMKKLNFWIYVFESQFWHRNVLKVFLFLYLSTSCLESKSFSALSVLKLHILNALIVLYVEQVEIQRTEECQDLAALLLWILHRILTWCFSDVLNKTKLLKI